MHRNKPVQLGNDLLDHMRRAISGDSDPAHGMIFADIGDSQAVDIIAARGEHARDTRQYTGFIIDQNGKNVTFNGFFVNMHQTRAFAWSSIVPFTSASVRSISVWAAPDGIIGKQLAS